MILTLIAMRAVSGGRAAFAVGLLVAAGLAAFLAYRYRGQVAPGPATEPDAPAEVAGVPAADHAKQLYQRSCAACHGDQGDGNGPAAKFLYPKPRNFGEAQFRVVTAANRIPSDRDLRQVLDHGMPGSAMFSFAHLSEAERDGLAGYVRQLARDAIIARQQAEQGAGVDLAELTREVDQFLTPGEPVEPPADLPPPGPESVARGKALYKSAGCASCHGETGKGDGAQEQRDSSGVPIRPRDFGRGYFKGGHDVRQLYARIVLGMPGTPMPASPNLKPGEIGDLINFVLSLSDAQSRARVEHQRTRVVARRAGGPLGPDIPDAVWGVAAPVRVVVSPLWWRNFTEPDLHVAAVHDGRSVAIRLTWRDDTRDDAPVRPQDFEDMAAVQLFKGVAEPFLGMGAADAAVDVWFWQASWSGQQPDVDSAHPDMAVDFYPFEQAGGGPRPHATERQAREFLPAPAVGNLRAEAGRGLAGSSIAAKGVGSVTMRPRTSQLVQARGRWTKEGWTVVLRRPLTVPPDAGVSLAPGDRVSVAFAVWDGAARDRNGQKLVSIWHDLTLE